LAKDRVVDLYHPRSLQIPLEDASGADIAVWFVTFAPLAIAARIDAPPVPPCSPSPTNVGSALSPTFVAIRRAHRDQEIAERAVKDGEGPLAWGAGRPNRIEWQLKSFPDQISNKDQPEVGTQAQEPSTLF
jgi:hypothetical protein